MEFLKNIWQTISSYTLAHLLPALAILAGGLLASRFVPKLLSKVLNKSSLDKSVSSLIIAVLRVAMLIIVILVAASSLGIDVSGVIALASVLTLAISLALQDALSNLIGGFTLLNTKPFSIGDYVEIDGQAGTVMQVGLTYTRLLTPDRKTVSIPNSSVDSAQIVNYTVNGTRRIDIAITASYDSDPELVLSVLKQAAQVSTALQDPAPYSAISAYNDSNIGYILQVWSASDNYWPTAHAINRNIHYLFKEAGIVMTYPHLNVHLDK